MAISISIVGYGYVNEKGSLTIGLDMVRYSDWEAKEMKITTDIKPVTYLKSNAALLLRNTLPETTTSPAVDSAIPVLCSNTQSRTVP